MKCLLCLLVPVCAALAQLRVAPVNTIHPPGVPVPATDRAELESGLARLRAATEKLKGNPLLPDVLIYQEAVRQALEYDEFFNANDIGKAKLLLQHGEERAGQLAEGKSPWTASPGLV